MLLVVPAPSSCFLLPFLASLFFYLVLWVFFSVLFLSAPFLCPISHFLFPQVLLFKVAHCLLPLPLENCSPHLPLLSLSFLCLFACHFLFLSEDCILEFLPSLFAAICSCFPSYYSTYPWGTVYLSFSLSIHMNILSFSTSSCLSKLTFISWTTSHPSCRMYCCLQSSLFPPKSH